MSHLMTFEDFTQKVQLYDTSEALWGGRGAKLTITIATYFLRKRCEMTFKNVLAPFFNTIMTL